MKRKSLLYVAGQYTHPDPVSNTHRVIRVADIIYTETNWVPVVPHLSLLWHMVKPHEDINFWYEYDLHLLGACAAIVRLPGASSGADAELSYAIESLKIEIVSFSELPYSAQKAWLDG